MFIPIVLAPIGSGALHPVGALHAAEAVPQALRLSHGDLLLDGADRLGAGTRHRRHPARIGQSRICWGRWAGRSASPHFGIQDNLTPIILLSVFRCPPCFLMASSIPRHHEHHAEQNKRKSERENGEAAFAVFRLLDPRRHRFAARLGAAGLGRFCAGLFEQKGWDPAAYGTITSSYWIASAVSGLVFGRLADRFDRRMVMMLSMLFSAPAFFLLPAYEGAFAFFLAIAAGGLSGGAHSLIVVMAQDLIPMRKGFASGAILGFIFATGAIGSLAIGFISDQIGLALTFQIVAVMIAVAGGLSLLLPRQAKA